MSKKAKLIAAKYAVYFFALLVLYVLQVTPGLLQFGAVKPNFMVCAAVCIAVFEEEFVGGLFGALAGLFCDHGSYTVFGFYSIQLLFLCTAVGLAVRFLVKRTVPNVLLLCAGALLWLGVAEYFFYYVMWDYEHSWLVFVYQVLPRVALSLPFALLFYKPEERFFLRVQDAIEA